MLKKKDPVTSRELELKLKLRQPEVSISMKALCDRGWVGYEKIKKEGKGRPFYMYFIKVSKDDIIGQLRKEVEKQIERLNKRVEEIEKYLGVGMQYE